MFETAQPFPKLISLAEAETGRLIRAFAAEKFGAETVSCVCLGGGSFGLAYLVDLPVTPLKIVLKAFRGYGMHRTQAYEMKLLAENCPIKMPEVLLLRDRDERIPFDILGMTFVEGSCAFTLDPRNYSAEKKRAFSDEIAAALVKLHGTTGPGFGPVTGPLFSSWETYYRQVADEIYAWTMRWGGTYLTNEITDLIGEAYTRFWDIFSQPAARPALVHGDLNVANIMADPQSLRVRAIIDPYRTMWADNEYELHEMANMTGDDFGLPEAYKRRVRVSKFCDLKCAFYALYNEVHCYMNSGLKFDPIFEVQCKNLRRRLALSGMRS